MPVNSFPNKLAPNMPNKNSINPTFCYVTSFLIVPLTPFTNIPDSPRGAIILMISFFSLIYIINVVLPYPNIFLWMFASVVDTVAFNSKGIKTLLANGLSTFPVKGNPVVSNGPKSIPENVLALFYAIAFLIVWY